METDQKSVYTNNYLTEIVTPFINFVTLRNIFKATLMKFNVHAKSNKNMISPVFIKNSN